MKLAALAAALVLSALAPAAAAAPPKIGDKAPSFTLPAADGSGQVSLDALLAKGKAVVVLFDATRCPYAKAYKGRVAALAGKYGPKGVSFATVNSNKTEGAEEVAADGRKAGFAFPVLKDEGSKVADLYGAQKTPEAFVLGPGGTLLYHGRIDESSEQPEKVTSPDLDLALGAVLAGQPVPRAETKAFGCSIKRP